MNCKNAGRPHKCIIQRCWGHLTSRHYDTMRNEQSEQRGCAAFAARSLCCAPPKPNPTQPPETAAAVTAMDTPRRAGLSA